MLHGGERTYDRSSLQKRIEESPGTKAGLDARGSRLIGGRRAPPSQPPGYSMYRDREMFMKHS
jgi:hypothetical protein